MNSRDLSILISVISFVVIVAVICVSYCVWIFLCVFVYRLFRWLFVMGKRAEWVDIRGKNVLVTGSNSGIGLSTAKILAGMNGKIFMTCRSKRKFNDAYEIIKEKNKDVDLEFVKLELSSLSSIEDCVNELKERGVKLDICIHNAGLMNDLEKRMEDENGLEIMFSVNTLGTFYLTELLLDTEVMKKNGSRMVFVNAKSHLFLKSEILKDHKMTDFLRHPIPEGMKMSMGLMGRSNSQMVQNFHQYSVTKMFMLMLIPKLHEKYHERTGVCFNSLHPGIISTDLAVSRDGTGSGPRMFFRKIFGKLFLKTCDEGAQCTVHVATSKELDGVSGLYFDNSQETETHEMVRDLEYQKEIWEIVQELIGEGRV